MTAVLVTRPGGENDPLVAELESRGFRVRAVPTVLTRAVPVEWPDFARYDWVVVTSAAGVAALPVALAGPRWAAVREATASALRARGVMKRGGPTSLPAITIGPRTSAGARDAGFQVVAEPEAAGFEQRAAAVTRGIPNTKPPGAKRPRRLRTSPAVRALVRETRLD